MKRQGNLATLLLIGLIIVGGLYYYKEKYSLNGILQRSENAQAATAVGYGWAQISEDDEALLMDLLKSNRTYTDTVKYAKGSFEGSLERRKSAAAISFLLARSRPKAELVPLMDYYFSRGDIFSTLIGAEMFLALKDKNPSLLKSSPADKFARKSALEGALNELFFNFIGTSTTLQLALSKID